MVQVLTGAQSFDSFPALRSAQRSPSDVLQGWMVLVPQVTVAAELLAISYAVEAARYELEAFASYDRAASWLASGTLQTVTFALSWFESMHYGFWRAWWNWQQASSWLTKYGDPAPEKPYTHLLADSLSQQQRFLQLGEGLRQLVAWLCHEWQVAVPETLKDGWPTEETGASSTDEA